MKEGSRLRLKAALAKYKLRAIPREIQGYSLGRIMIFGLILPAIVAACMVAGIALAFWFGFSLLMKFGVLAFSTLVGFTAGTLIFLRLYDRMLRFAKVRR
ncbi:MAG: hypothetical protein ACXQTF_04240 [Candidatus Hecatellaceae archaeon]|nr:MAG: hypothetical protein DRO43_02715 [Candidatus Hecatellales archaeon]